MAITPPVPIPPAPALPQRNDPVTFEARSDAYYAWQSEALPDGIDAQSSATYTNAQEAAQSAVNADQSAQLSEQFAEDAEVARDKAQEWAESPTAPEPGSKSAKTWAGESKDYRDSAAVIAAAVGSDAGLPSMIGQEGKALVVVPGASPGDPPSAGWGMLGLHRTEIITSGTWTPPFYPFTCILDAIGGGGGGAVSNSSPGQGMRGGGSGRVANPAFLTLTEGQQLEIVIGAGGAPDTNGGQTVVSVSGAGEVQRAYGGGAANTQFGGSGSAGGGGVNSAGGDFGRDGGGPVAGAGIFRISGTTWPSRGWGVPFLPPSIDEGRGGRGVATGDPECGGGGGGGFGPGGDGGASGQPGHDGAPGGGGGGGAGFGGAPSGSGGVGMVRIYY